MKINKILPIISLTTIGSIAMPLISCGCGSHIEDDEDDTIKFDKTWIYPVDATDLYVLSTSNQELTEFFTMEADKEYNFLIDFKWYPWDKSCITEPPEVGSFLPISDYETENVIWSNIEISIDNNPLSPDETKKLEEDKTYYWDESDQTFYYRFDNITKDSSIKMKLQSSETKTTMFGMYVPGWE